MSNSSILPKYPGWHLILGILVCAAFQAHADTTQEIVLPGEVAKVHAKFENDCKSCHKQFDKAAQASLCKDCHKEIAKDILDRRGLHGQHDPIQPCYDCHVEHKGRDAHLFTLDTKNFNHEKETGFELKGGHLSSKVPCKDCHLPHKKFRLVQKTCNGCHAKDDKHKGTLGTECQNCHEETGWKRLHFDHSKTRFQILGKHIDVKCLACHLNYRFKHTPTSCFECHRKDDKHKGQEGKKCETCHDARSWKTTAFDHRLSRFALTGLHVQVACNKCHTTDRFKDARLDCWSCHKKDDVHKRRLATDCEYCHNTRNWKDWNFDHDKTKFKLLGKHRDLPCIDCHRTPVKKKMIVLPITCDACHDEDDKHDGAFGQQCGRCHTALSWKNIKVGSMNVSGRRSIRK